MYVKPFGPLVYSTATASAWWHVIISRWVPWGPPTKAMQFAGSVYNMYLYLQRGVNLSSVKRPSIYHNFH